MSSTCTATSKKKEKAPDGGKDENVFDIQQGVAIILAVKEEGKTALAQVHQCDSWGSRAAKYAALWEADINATPWNSLLPSPPSYLFVPRDIRLLEEYEHGWVVPTVFPINASTVTTARNDFSMAYSPDTLCARVGDLRREDVEDAVIRQKYELEDLSYWNLRSAREQLAKVKHIDSYVKPYCYRPFDFRYVFYHEAVCERLRQEVMQHMDNQNLAFLTHRPQSPGDFTFAFCTRLIGDQCVAANKTAGGGNSFQFPLYLYPEAGTGKHGQTELGVETAQWPAGPGGRRPNLSPAFVGELAKLLGLNFVPDGKGDLQTTFGPEDVFHYMYAVFHSPTYRKRYAEFLKSDFPRLPLTSDRSLFVALTGKGSELVSLHLMESPKLDQLITTFPEKGSNLVEKVTYVDALQRVCINGIQYFQGVPREAWEFHIGGYQVLEKWLKDRKGRELTWDDTQHYQKVVVALKETIRVMGEVDAAIPKWPIE